MTWLLIILPFTLLKTSFNIVTYLRKCQQELINTSTTIISIICMFLTWNHTPIVINEMYQFPVRINNPNLSLFTNNVIIFHLIYIPKSHWKFYIIKGTQLIFELIDGDQHIIFILENYIFVRFKSNWSLTIILLRY